MRRTYLLIIIFSLLIFIITAHNHIKKYINSINISFSSLLADLNQSQDLEVTVKEAEIVGLPYNGKKRGGTYIIPLDDFVFRKHSGELRNKELFPFGIKTPSEVKDYLSAIEKKNGINPGKEFSEWMKEQKTKLSKYSEWFTKEKVEIRKDLRNYISRKVSLEYAKRRSQALKKIVLYGIPSVFSGIFIGVVSSLIFGSNQRSAPYDMAKASGRWASLTEIYRHYLILPPAAKKYISFIPGLSYLMRNYLTRKNYFPLGKPAGAGALFRVGLMEEDRNTHMLICAPTNAGKTSNLIIPGLLYDAESEGSAMVIDAKSPELYNTVGGAWMKNGKKVILFDPWHEACIGFNPLPKASNEELLTIVRAFMGNPSRVAEDQRFFRARTQALLFALLKLTQTFPEELCNLPVTYLLAENVPDLENKLALCRDEKVKRLFKNFLMSTNEQKINMLMSVSEKLQLFRDEKVQAAFSRSDFDLSILFREKEPALLIVGVPHDKGELGTLIASLMSRLVLNRAFEETRLKQQKEERGEGPVFTPNPLYLYLDEFPSLNIPDIAEKIRMSRYTRTQFIICVQDLSELEALYIQYKSIIGNLRTKIFLTGCGLDTAKYVSEMLGKTRADTERYSKRILSILPGSKYKQWEEDLLMSPDSIQNMPKGLAVCFTEHTRPFLLRLENKDNSREIASKIVPLKGSNLKPYRPNPEPLKPPKIPSMDEFLGINEEHKEMQKWLIEQNEKKKELTTVSKEPSMVRNEYFYNDPIRPVKESS